MSDTLTIAALQTVSTPEVPRNLVAARQLIAQAADQGAQLVALPEYFCLMGRSDRDKLGVAERPGAGPIQDALAEAAARHRLWVVGGTLPMAVDAAPGQPADAPVERVRNACLVFDPQGRPAARYDKMHLFAYDNGRERYDEARVLQAGSAPVALDVDGWRVGLGVCYDLRFPEYFRALMQPAPCDLLVLPAAFTFTTGQAHWELLLRARAVENQCYVLAPAQGGLHENGRRTYGNSLVADPWGEVLAIKREGEAVVLATMSRQRLAEVRGQLPALQHRRL